MLLFPFRPPFFRLDNDDDDDPPTLPPPLTATPAVFGDDVDDVIRPVIDPILVVDEDPLRQRFRFEFVSNDVVVIAADDDDDEQEDEEEEEDDVTDSILDNKRGNGRPVTLVVVVAVVG